MTKIIGLSLLAVGVVSIFIQNTFYGYIDAEGIIHDSIFLPLGVFAIIIGLFLLLILVAKGLFNRMKNSAKL